MNRCVLRLLGVSAIAGALSLSGVAFAQSAGGGSGGATGGAASTGLALVAAA